jgi:hypothetical protein
MASRPITAPWLLDRASYEQWQGEDHELAPPEPEPEDTHLAEYGRALVGTMAPAIREWYYARLSRLGRGSRIALQAWLDLEKHLLVAERERESGARGAMRELQRLRTAWIARRRSDRPWSDALLEKYLIVMRERIHPWVALASERWQLEERFADGSYFPETAQHVLSMIRFRHLLHAELNEREGGRGHTGNPLRDAAAWYLHDAGWTFEDIARLARMARPLVRNLFARATAAQLEEASRRHRDRAAVEKSA